MVLVKRILATFFVVLGFASSARAERPGVLARQMGNAGTAFHGSFGGRENVYWDTGSRFGARVRARAAYNSSPGHRDNLRAPGIMLSRVVRGQNGVGVVTRGLR